MFTMFNRLMMLSLLASLSLSLYLSFSIPIQSVKNSVLPGYQTSDIEALNPSFKKLTEKTIRDLESLGYIVNIRATYRDSDYQNFLYDISKLTEKFLNRKITSVRGGESRHNKTFNGIPGSCAMDISPTGLSVSDQAKFYKDLIVISKKRGLKTGGTFRQTNPTWSEYDLGWDPGHVYMTWGSCKRGSK